MGPVIYQLAINRFRGIRSLSWHPASGVNVILGGGDAGKTTILDAIGLLLSPTNAATLSDADYHLRDVDEGFEIEGVFPLPPAGGINDQTKPSWPWHWNGSAAVVPGADADAQDHPVYRPRVRGTAALGK